MRAKLAILLASVALIAAACNNNNQTNKTTPPPPPAATPPAATPPSSSNVISGETTISITDTGYSPAAITVKKGTKVNFVNNSTKTNWPASAPHPTHTDYPAFDPKQAIAVGGTWSFTFDRVGNWRYHDHLNATKFGSVTVVE